MLTPPSTPKEIRVRKAFESPPSTPASLTPRALRRASSGSSPPPAPRLSSVLKALSRKNVQELEALIEDDPNLVFVPIKGNGRIEPPLFCALRTRCPLNIIKLLLNKGATPFEGDLNGLTLLATEMRSKQSSWKIPLIPMLGDCSFPAPPPPMLGHMQVPSTDDFVASFVPAIPLCAHQSWRPISSDLEEDGWELSVATCLLQHGADPFKTDARGLCAVDYATQAGKSALVDLMQNWCQWQDCRLHYLMGTMSLALKTSDVANKVYEFLLPRKLVPSKQPYRLVRAPEGDSQPNCL